MGHSVFHWTPPAPMPEDDLYAGPVNLMQPLPDAPEDDAWVVEFYDPISGTTEYRIENPRPDATRYPVTGPIDPIGDGIARIGKKVSDAVGGFFGGIGSAAKRILYSVLLFLAVGVVVFYFLRAFAARGAARIG